MDHAPRPHPVAAVDGPGTLPSARLVRPRLHRASVPLRCGRNLQLVHPWRGWPFCWYEGAACATSRSPSCGSSASASSSPARRNDRDRAPDRIRVGLASPRSGVLPILADRPPLRSVAHVLNTGREQEIAVSVGAHRDLGGGYDDAIAAGLVERIGAEVDRRVDERISLYQGVGQSSADGAVSRDCARHQPATHPGSPVSWQQTILAFGFHGDRRDHVGRHPRSRRGSLADPRHLVRHRRHQHGHLARRSFPPWPPLSWLKPARPVTGARRGRRASSCQTCTSGSGTRAASRRPAACPAGRQRTAGRAVAVRAWRRGSCWPSAAAVPGTAPWISSRARSGDGGRR